MKRQIDPNLSSNESENILFSDGAPKEKTEFKLTEKTPSHGRKQDENSEASEDVRHGNP